jgi:hypothetical protein
MTHLTLFPRSAILDDPDNSVNHKLILAHPKDCEEILATKNHNNRSLRRNAVTKYAEDMKTGRYRERTHQGIAFDINNNLIDGQHRLTAISRQNKSIAIRVWVNRDPEDYSVIDSGLARIAADSLKHIGCKNFTSIATGIKHIMLYRQHPNRVWTNYSVPSHTEICDFYEQNKEVLERIAKMVSEANYRYKFINRTGLFVLCYFALEAGFKEMEVNAFCHNLSSGADLATDSPILAYRAFLANQKKITENLQQYSVACLFKVWNYVQTKQSLKLFKVPSMPPTSAMPALDLPKTRNEQKISTSLRHTILSRDNFTCQDCGAKASNGAQLEVDHHIPRSKGGSNDESNLVTLCRDCNHGKSDTLIPDF